MNFTPIERTVLVIIISGCGAAILAFVVTCFWNLVAYKRKAKKSERLKKVLNYKLRISDRPVNLDEWEQKIG